MALHNVTHIDHAARGIYDDETKKITLQSGSILTIQPEATKIPGNIKANYKAVKEHIKNGNIRLNEKKQLIVENPISGLSPSAARVFVDGKSGSGRNAWLIDGNQKLATIHAKRERKESHANGRGVGRPKARQERSDVKRTCASLQPVNAQNLGCAASAFAKLLNLTNRAEADFSQFYQTFKGCFDRAFFKINGDKVSGKQNWPDLPGVYVVRDNRAPNDYNALMYVGMTGKIRRKTPLLKGMLSKRPDRRDPYYFKEDGFCYDYNRKTKNYRSKLECKNMEVECFVYNPEHLAAPLFLESLLLQAYALCGPNRLPPANNEF